jgi:hypothetical protein
MGSQLLFEFRHKKGDFSVVNCSSLLLRGAVNDLDPGLQSTMVVGKPLGYLPDGISQRCVLLHPGLFKFFKVNLEVLGGMTPTTVVNCTLNTIQIAYTYEGNRGAGDQAQDQSDVCLEVEADLLEHMTRPKQHLEVFGTFCETGQNGSSLYADTDGRCNPVSNLDPKNQELEGGFDSAQGTVMTEEWGPRSRVLGT